MPNIGDGSITTSKSLASDQAPTIAIIIPCHNEGAVIATVIEAFKTHLPAAIVYVYDNNSDDDTAQQAENAGAVLRREQRQGKGHVVRRALSEIDADLYILVDGDGTYDPGAASELIGKAWSQRLDMVVGVREHSEETAYRRGHRWGNRVLSGLVAQLFGKGSRDMLSGYRVLSRPFVKSFPSTSTGFEIETEMTVHALQLKLPIAEMTTRYNARQAGSASKLRTIRDGSRILLTIFLLLKHHRPFLLFGGLALILVIASLMVGLPVVLDFVATGFVPRIPSAVLAASLMVIAVVSCATGIILASVARMAREQRRLIYLVVPRSAFAARSAI